MLRALIVDDERLSRLALRQLLSDVPDVAIVGECRDAAEAQQSLADVDVVFLDVQMPVRSGLVAARDWEAMPSTPFIIFVTAFDEFALPAYETEAVDYLTKPVRPARLAKSLKRVRDRMQHASSDLRLARPLVTRVGDSEIVIPIDKIECIEADGVYAVVWYDSRPVLLRVPLDALQVRLAPYGFARVHRSWLVAMSRIQSVRLERGCDRRSLMLTSGRVVPVSRRRLRALRMLLQRGFGS